MKQSEVVDRVAAATGLPRRSAANVVSAIIAAIRTAALNGEPVSIRGLGTFVLTNATKTAGRKAAAAKRTGTRPAKARAPARRSAPRRSGGGGVGW
jgi:nucleoid DNA-binding protein